MHTLFNKGVVVAPEARTVDSVLATCGKYDVEVLPTTPTFLRMMLMSGAVPDKVPACLQVITYGTERMDQPTLDELCRLLPAVDFRQTFGMSELGIVRVKSERRDSLFMKVGGEGVETRVVDNVLQIRSESRMLGYLNAPSPFDAEGWYDTKDVVEVKDGYYKVVGRVSDVINVGGLKFMASEVERVALKYPGVSLVKAIAKSNPITGQHVELSVQPVSDGAVDKDALTAFLAGRAATGHGARGRDRDHRALQVGHRFKLVRPRQAQGLFIRFVGANLVLRDIEEQDAQFVFDLRTDPVKSRHLSATSGRVEDQVEWIRAYRDKTDQAYFIVCDKDGNRLGCIRMYDPARPRPGRA